jgi:hypothetical protein
MTTETGKTEALITLYVGMDMQFLVLQLLKEYEAGDNRPAALEYHELEGGSLLEETPMAYTLRFC